MTITAPPALPVILVDDDPDLLCSGELLLQLNGISPVMALDGGEQLLDRLEEGGAAVVVLDLIMPGISGRQLLPQIVNRFPHIPVVVMTAMHDVETAVGCMREGASDYLVKPVEENRFISAVRRAAELSSLRRQLETLKHYLLHDHLNQAGVFAPVITISRKMRAIFQYVEAVAALDEPLLVTGETGTGKELLVEVIHQASRRKGKLVAINVAGLDDTLFSDTLFGHRMGAFTGANRPREGLLAQAEGGTLFLDEIGELPATSQVKLLRLLQERKYYALGSDYPQKSTARVVCATNRNLHAAMQRGQFREDLFFRLATHQIELPPLRERKEDLPLLISHFLEEAAHSMGKPSPTPPPELFALLASYHFPGNIRELKAMIFDAVARHQARMLSTESFRTLIAKSAHSAPQAGSVISSTNLFHQCSGPLPSLKQAEELLISAALERCSGNQRSAAAMLGISRQALNRRLNSPE